jgi:AcrR family transcriptional regulator
MPGKQRISQDSIIDAALSIIRHSGWESVSARSLAEELGTSTMPIYSSIGSMEALKAKARNRCMKALEEYQGRSWTDDPLMDSAIGYIQFAKNEGRLFRFAFDSRGSARATKSQVEEKADEIVAQNADFMAAFSSMPRQGAAAVAFHSWVYVHGLACLLSDGLLTLEDDELRRCLEEACGAIYLHIGGSNG